MHPTIYKIRMFVNKADRKNGGFKRIEYSEEIILDNIKTAKAYYASAKNTMKTYSGLMGFCGSVELFVPHIFDNGVLAYYPDNDNYIEKCDMNE